MVFRYKEINITYHNWNRTGYDKQNTVSDNPDPSQSVVPILQEKKEIHIKLFYLIVCLQT